MPHGRWSPYAWSVSAHNTFTGSQALLQGRRCLRCAVSRSWQRLGLDKEAKAARQQKRLDVPKAWSAS